ncbi:CaiB/BaiF CoA transferase family protein [Nocardia alni]|uniref:CaiB/BaiF CoA transferase family protein n=1 Tax=Nocardia alni TaxID=2815723 RepID=UPI001C237CD5|nr:CoA transferase [Nocardia alni]
MSETTNAATSATGPLAGVRVLDLCRVVSGPFGSLLLADLGAEVIRVEPLPAAGTAQPGEPADLTEEEAFHWGLNRNKKSISLDLKSPAGQEIFHRLVADADVVYDNFRPGVTARLGIDRDTLLAYNPTVITCSLTGFGADGPWAKIPAYDPIVQAMSGTMNYTRIDHAGSPVRWGIPIGDLFAGIYAAIGVLGAVMHRDRAGVGQHVDVSMLDVMLALNTYRVPQALTFGQEPDPAPFEGGQGTVPFGNFECSEGWIATCISQRMWKDACEVFRRPDLITDERFSTGHARHAHRDELVTILQGIFRKRTADEWQHELMAVGVVCGKVTGIAEVFQHPQILARNMAVEIRDQYDRVGTVAGDSLRFSDTSTWCAPRAVGADTALVLSSLLGTNDDELDRLRDERVIHLADATGGTPLAPHTRFVPGDATGEPAQRPLHGVTVLELNGDEPSKGFAAQFLADLGARVIRVDRPVGQVVEPYPDHSREASFRAGLNRGKLSVIANLKDSDGHALFDRLVEHADVVLDNYRPGVLERLGIDNDSLRVLNPRIISTSITGFGHTGPWSSFPAFDNAIQALGGGMSITTDPRLPDVPIRWGNPIGGLTGAMFATLGTLAALRQRHTTGQGRKLDISLLDSQVALLSYRVPQAVTVGKKFLPEPRRGGTGSLPFGAFATKDDTWFVICITPQFWSRFCQAAGAPEWEKDPRFVTEPLRRANEAELYALVEPSFLRRTAAEWQELYIEKGLPGAKVLTLAEAFEHPQALARSMRVRLPDHEVPGGIEVANAALKFSVCEPVPAISAPVPGRDTATLAAEVGFEAPIAQADSPAARWEAAAS